PRPSHTSSLRLQGGSLWPTVTVIASALATDALSEVGEVSSLRRSLLLMPVSSDMFETVTRFPVSRVIAVANRLGNGTQPPQKPRPNGIESPIATSLRFFGDDRVDLPQPAPSNAPASA